MPKLPKTPNLDKPRQTKGETDGSIRVQLQLRIMQPQFPVQRRPEKQPERDPAAEISAAHNSQLTRG
jgi:hypothetical protein